MASSRRCSSILKQAGESGADLEGLGAVVEVAHAVALVGDDVQQAVRVRGVGVLDVQLPRGLGPLAHDVAPRQPRLVPVVLPVRLALDALQRLCSLHGGSPLSAERLATDRGCVARAIRAVMFRVDMTA